MPTRFIETPRDLDMLRFYPVPRYEGAYEINLSGEVRSLPRYVNSPIAGGQRLFPARQVKTRAPKGYPSFNACVGRRKKTLYVHRILAELFIPNPDGKPCINHIDGDKGNFALSNLEWCTHLENMRHAFRTGLAPLPTSGPGDLSPAARLTWDDVREIRRLSAAGGRSRASLAAQFQVSTSNVTQIIRGVTWRETA